ncbi:MAG: hypothetical protein R3266_13365, partial [Gemmatimonadota bacterium]|nr:hypothetical protein [Gemmatimonadota bacterium]
IGRGTARVAFDKLIDIAPGESLYRVTAEGRATSGGSTIRRRVGRLAWVADPPRLPATLVAWGGTAGTGPSGSVSGFDAGSGCPGTPASIAGLASLAAGPPPFPSLALAGSPPTLVWPPGTSLAAETGIRWTELLAPYGPRSDATVPPDPWPGPGAGGGWPFIRLAGPATIGGGRSGRGTLVVDGDLTIGAGFSWTGLVLVGGALSFRGAATIRGGALAGLAGAAAPALDLGSAALDLRYDACAVARAAGRITAPAAGLPGTWFEAW